MYLSAKCGSELTKHHLELERLRCFFFRCHRCPSTRSSAMLGCFRAFFLLINNHRCTILQLLIKSEELSMLKMTTTKILYFQGCRGNFIRPRTEPTTFDFVIKSHANTILIPTCSPLGKLCRLNELKLMSVTDCQGLKTFNESGHCLYT